LPGFDVDRSRLPDCKPFPALDIQTQMVSSIASVELDSSAIFEDIDLDPLFS